MKHLLYTLYFMLLVSALVACRGEEPKRMPDTLPDMEGNIVSLDRPVKEDDKVVQLFVKAPETQEEGFPEASIRVDESTLIEDKDGKVLKPAHLQQGQQVEVWFENEVMESMPVQATAKAVRVQLQ